MGRTRQLDALVAPLRADTVSGAAVVARRACDVVRQATGQLEATSPGALREQLVKVLVRVLAAQPAMAPLVSLARAVLDSVEGASTVDEARHLAADAASGFGADLDARAQTLAREGAALLATGATVLTVSASSSVRDALLHDSAPRSLRVICLESRPLNEGQVLAEGLSRAGISVVYAVDAAASSLMADCTTVLLGADSIGDAGVINKVGSTAVVESARRLGIPVHVIADATKILPPGFPQPVEDDRPPDEVWRAPAGVRVWNRYFEAVPLRGLTSFVTDLGEFSPSALEEHRRGLDVPEALRAWLAQSGAHRTEG